MKLDIKALAKELAFLCRDGLMGQTCMELPIRGCTLCPFHHPYEMKCEVITEEDWLWALRLLSSPCTSNNCIHRCICKYKENMPLDTQGRCLHYEEK